MLDDLSPVFRPLTLPELGLAFGVPAARLRRLAEKEKIRPACYIAGTGVYVGKQIDRFATALREAAPRRPARFSRV